MTPEMRAALEQLLREVAANSSGWYREWDGKLYCKDRRCPLGVLVVTRHGPLGLNDSLIQQGGVVVGTHRPIAYSAARYLQLPVELCELVALDADNGYPTDRQEVRELVDSILLRAEVTPL